MNLNLSELKELFALIAERDITEFELEEEGVKLRIKKGGSATVSEPLVPVAARPVHPRPLRRPPLRRPTQPKRAFRS